MASIDDMSTVAGAQRATASFGDRLAELVAARESQLVLGLDPDPERLWPEALDAEDPGEPAESWAGGEALPAMRAARAVAAHCALVIEAVAEHCVAVKPQVACFERLGAPGWAALTETVAVARERGLLVIADAKRGDVEVTATAYAQGFLGETPTPYGPVPGLGADAMTVNPLLGSDSLAPFVKAARASGRGLFVLVRTSNPGAADVQERELVDGHSVSHRLADLVHELGAGGIGRHRLSDIGAVVGATAPDRLEALRERMPHAVFLLPGIGAQGGRVEDLAPAFAAGPASGLISASRSIVTAHERDRGDPASAAAAEAARLRGLGWRLAA
ncbi:MAG: orotidine-5'-phosphate decarboxylase [Solirubrobacterales bacterium]|nr:orotidine-5'-phosphate decarboxylase [Solirubrobacterales bacterium]